VTAQTAVLPGSDVTVFWFPTRHTDLLGDAATVPLYACDANGYRLGS
jgi:5-formyltetrahydrofolate cyclo-ligase